MKNNSKNPKALIRNSNLLYIKYLAFLFADIRKQTPLFHLDDEIQVKSECIQKFINAAG